MTDKTTFRTALQSSRILRYGLWGVGLFVLFGALGFLALPPLVKHVATDKLSEALHRPVTIRKVSVNPYALTLTVDGLNIEEREGGATFAAFESLFLNVQASSLLRWGLVIDEIRLVEPKFHAVRLTVDHYNFSDLFDEFMAELKEHENEPTTAFSLNNIQISGGTVEFEDRVTGEKHAVENIALALPFVSSMNYATGILVEPRFSALIDGAPLDLKGKGKPFAETMESEFQLSLNGVQLPKYFDYSPVKLPMTLETGVLNADLTLVFGQQPGKMPRLVVSGTASIDDLKATGPEGQALAACKRLDVAVVSADVFGGRLAIGRAALDSPEIVVRVSREGTIDWLDMLPEQAEAAAGSGQTGAPPPAPFAWSLGELEIAGGALRWDDASNPRAFQADIKAIDARVKNLDGQGSVAEFEAAWTVDGGERLKVDEIAVHDGKLDLARQRIWIGGVHLKGARASIARLADGRIEWIAPPALRLAASAQKNTAPPWTVEIAQSVGEGVDIRFEDATLSPKAVQSIEGLRFELANVSSEPGRTAGVKAEFRFNRKGEAAVDGKLGLEPLDAELKVSAKTVELLPLRQYFAGKLNADVTRGHVTADGKVSLRQLAQKDGAGESGALTGGFAGQLTVGDFQAVDKVNAGEFLRWKSLHFSKVDARLGPESVTIGEIALADFFARVVVSRDGKLNLLEIARQDAPPPQAPPAAPESPDGTASAPVAVGGGLTLPVTVGKITLQGGSVRFTDNFIKPNYTADLRAIGGSVTGLSSSPGTQARLELRGRYDKVAPLTVSARINPLSAKPYLDLQAGVKDIDLTSLSAYSGKYAGYAIEKGKLSLSVKYKIENDLLEAENRVFLDQLTFGDAVASPDATALPVRLAVALLKNRNGEIDIDLPISGSLNDPQFSVGGLVVKMIVNLLVKAATSPFALIGSMFGGGEELADVEFAPGRAALTEDAVKRLENLARALIERPALRFEIEGQANPEQDAEGLKHARLERKIRALKRGDAAEQSDEDDSSSRLAALSEQEYPALLERVYSAENFPKPRNMIGLEKSLPVEEMEKLILAHTIIGEDDVKNLGDRRAKAVRDWLVTREVAAERIFLLPIKVMTASEGESGRRARFSLK
ncbi:MAG: DUF748 domain-containing protein [Candidatus Accumulibacter sp.]|jgi:uncharacterized protein involved in outer membrane biogenesis|nr:DUF748 domain-containing protein [Accumulibacter sp.]